MKPPKYIFLILLLLSLASYGNSLKGDFIWDDKPLIAENPIIKNPQHIYQLFIRDLYKDTGANYYRPILQLSFALNYFFARLNTFGYHLLNLLLHVLVAFLLYLLLNKILSDTYLSFLSSLIFVIHPIHSQVVSYISGRADSLVALFIMLSLLFYLQSKTINRYLFSLLCFFMALFTKEIAIMLPIVLAVWGLKRSVPFFGAGLLYIIMRLTILNFAAGNPFLEKKGFGVLDFGVWQRVYMFLKTMLIYLGSFFVPVRLHLERIIVHEGVNIYYYVGIFVAIFLFVALFRKRKEFSCLENKAIFFFIFWFFVWLLPQSAFIFPKIMADHFIYLPSISLCFFLALFVRSIKSVTFKKILVVFLSIYFISLSWFNNKMWQKELVFFEKTVELSPYSVRARDSLAALYLEAGRYDDAEKQYSRLLFYSNEIKDQAQRNKAKSSCYYNLGVIFDRTSRLKEALMAYRLALVFDPKMPQGYNNAGLILQKIGNVLAAEASFKMAIEVDPFYYQAYNNLAQLYAQEKRLWEAVGLWMQALVIYPDYEIAKKNLDVAQALLKLERK